MRLITLAGSPRYPSRITGLQNLCRRALAPHLAGRINDALGTFWHALHRRHQLYAQTV